MINLVVILVTVILKAVFLAFEVSYEIWTMRGERTAFNQSLPKSLAMLDFQGFSEFNGYV